MAIEGAWVTAIFQCWVLYLGYRNVDAPKCLGQSPPV
jgi:hypothetical protein